MLRNLPKASFVGVDPYPGLDHVKREFLDSIRLEFANDKVALFEKLDEVPLAHPGFGLIHIDGEHSEVAVFADLSNAASRAKKNAILIIDDIWHTQFPGIASATFKFIHNSKYVPFLISQSKIYLCEREFHPDWHERTLEIAEEAGVPFETGFPVGAFGEEYEQPNSISGFQQIIIKNDQLAIQQFLRRIDALAPLFHDLSIKKALWLLAPPIIGLLRSRLMSRSAYLKRKPLR